MPDQAGELFLRLLVDSVCVYSRGIFVKISSFGRARHEGLLTVKPMLRTVLPARLKTPSAKIRPLLHFAKAAEGQASPSSRTAPGTLSSLLF